MNKPYNGPQRILCLTAETAETLYLLGEDGPAPLTEGARQLHTILAKVVNCEPLKGLEPFEPLDPDFTL